MRKLTTEACLWAAIASTFLYDAGYEWALWLAGAVGVVSALVYLRTAFERTADTEDSDA